MGDLTSQYSDRKDICCSARTIFGIAGLIIVLVAAAFAGYQQVFSTFVDYDDEGYVMMSLHNVMQGRPIYDETYTQYGPAFFQIQTFLHEVFNLPVTHNVIRIKTLVAWLAICLLSFATVFVLTRSFALAISGFAAIFCLLERFCVEPGHPQELTALAVVGILFLAAQFRRGSTGSWQNNLILAGMAVIVAIAGLTKANIGVLLFFGVVATLFLFAEQNRLLDFVTPRFLLVGAAVPILLIARYWSIQKATLLPLLTAASIGLVFVMSQKRKMPKAVSSTNLLVFLGTLLLTAAVVIGTAWMQGTSVNGLLDGLVRQHLGFGGVFFSATAVTAAIIPATILSGILALLFLRGHYRVLTLLRVCAITLTAVLLIQFFFETTSPSTGGNEFRLFVKTLTSFVPLISWIILFPANGIRQTNPGETADRYDFARLMLCLVSAFQLLICYPIPGSQIAMASFPLLIVLLIAISDFIKVDLPYLLQAQSSRQKELAITGLLVVLSAATLAYRDVSLWQRRSAFEPLNLPGAELIHLPAYEVQKYQQLTRYLQENADSFIFRENTQSCLYFWTGIEPPTAINATIWPYLLNEQQQQRTVDRLADIERVIVISIYGNYMLPTDNAPLADYITQRFEPTGKVAGFDIWTRKIDRSKREVAGLN